jgi:GTPase SAR1 family protein
MEKPLTVLVIGPSQNGKSTFVNRLVNLATTEVSYAKEGDGNFKCTETCTVYDLEVPLTDYKLVSVQDGMDYNVPDLKEEVKFLGGAWWKKQTKTKYAIRPRQPHGPCIRLRLIDTPGLDDSEGKDYENLKEVLGTLNTMAKSPVKWEREIRAVALVYNANNAFSYSFQNTIKDYQRCMPNLFGGLSVINTNFSVTTWAQKRQNFVRDKILGDAETTKHRLLKEHCKEFAKILGPDSATPTHFFIDSKPKDSFMFDEYLSCNTISDILNFWGNSTPMEIGQMRLIKNDNMQAIDRVMQSLLNFAVNQWEADKRDLLQHVSNEEALHSHFEQQHREITDDISRFESDLDRYDNDSEFTIQKYMTSDDASAPELGLRWILRAKMKNSFYIQEPDYPEYQVDAQNGVNDRWTSHSFDYSSNSWTGYYEANPGKLPRLTARSYTTNRVFHRDTISKLRSDVRRARVRLAQNDAMLARHAPADSGNQNPKLEAFVSWITTAKDLVEVLGQKEPPLDLSFDEAARSRYAKQPRNVDQGDVFYMVKLVKPELVKPLRAVLMD